MFLIGNAAIFYGLAGISISSDGTFAVVVDFNGHKIRTISGLVLGNSTTVTVSTLAGQAAHGTDDGIGTFASFYFPYGCAISNDMSYAIIAGGSDNRIRKIILSTGEVSTVVGISSASSSQDGPTSSATLIDPRDVSLFQNDEVIVVVEAGRRSIKIIGSIEPTSSPTPLGRSPACMYSVLIV